MVDFGRQGRHSGGHFTSVQCAATALAALPFVAALKLMGFLDQIQYLRKVYGRFMNTYLNYACPNDKEVSLL